MTDLLEEIRTIDIPDRPDGPIWVGVESNGEHRGQIYLGLIGDGISFSIADRYLTDEEVLALIEALQNQLVAKGAAELAEIFV